MISGYKDLVNKKDVDIRMIFFKEGYKDDLVVEYGVKM